VPLRHNDSESRKKVKERSPKGAKTGVPDISLPDEEINPAPYAVDPT
jgi:hypothetical protein